MLSTKTVLENLTGHQMVEVFVQWMVKEQADFYEDYQRYTSAIDLLRKELGGAVVGEIEAIEQQCASDLLFSGLLGLKANLDNFIDPVARSFLDVDFEVYLREETAHRLPGYEQAQKARDEFYSRLTPAQKELYGDVITYDSHLKTVGPKLAHYFGYMLGNELLPRVVPGYHIDSFLTMRYTAMLERYLGGNFIETICEGDSSVLNVS